MSGPTHRLDIEFSYLSQSSADAHGLIGQSIADPLPRYGRLDVYPDSGTFTTSAQSEGAIDGTGEMYVVASPFATDFAFSRFAGGTGSHVAGNGAAAGTAEAAVASCNTALTKEIAYVDRRLHKMALGIMRQSVNGWRRFMRLLHAEADAEAEAEGRRVVVRATSRFRPARTW